MLRTVIESNKLNSIGYYPEKLILEIELKTKDIYHFLNVPRRIYQNLLNPVNYSYDEYYDRVIKKTYSFYKVAD